MRTSWIPHEDCAVLLRLLTPANALVMETALNTGLRVGDVLALRTEKLRKRQFSVREQKTGKARRVYLPKSLRARLLAQAGETWVFSGVDPARHRTRQAVWKDVKRASVAMRVKRVGCHTARKVYAVDIYKKKGLEACRKALGHDRLETTLIYLASELL